MDNMCINQGYLRADGKKGIRNKVLVLYTVNCSSFVAKAIQNSFPNSLDTDVDELGFDGCFDNELIIRMLMGFIRHPNVGAVLVVGHGCEYINAQKLSEYALKQGKLSDWFNVQDLGGTSPSIEHGKKIVQTFLDALKSNTEQVPVYLSDLVFGAECGGSDFTSGLAGNSIVGRFNDFIIDQGGTAIFEEIAECIGLKQHLVDRAVSEQVAHDVAQVYDKGERYSKAIHQFSISPGNFVGGLTTIEEKSMGALVKSGSKQIQGVVGIGETPPHNGLWLMDGIQDDYFMQFGLANVNDSEGVTNLISCGAHIVFLVTGRGHTIGAPIAPVIKVTGNARTYKKMSGDIDIDASAIIEKGWSLDEAAGYLLQYVKDVCNGKQTKSEALGHMEYYLHYNYQKSRKCCNP